MRARDPRLRGLFQPGQTDRPVLVPAQSQLVSQRIETNTARKSPETKGTFGGAGGTN